MFAGSFFPVRVFFKSYYHLSFSRRFEYNSNINAFLIFIRLFLILFFVCMQQRYYRNFSVFGLQIYCSHGPSRLQFFNNQKMAQEPRTKKTYNAFAYRSAMGNYKPQIYKYIVSKCKHELTSNLKLKVSQADNVNENKNMNE